MKIQGFWDRVDEVCAEDGRHKYEIVKAMGERTGRSYTKECSVITC
jgi:hypothetical protein